jgi:hypothetical protein
MKRVLELHVFACFKIVNIFWTIVYASRISHVSYQRNICIDINLSLCLIEALGYE